jgi:hypothetical protein
MKKRIEWRGWTIERDAHGWIARKPDRSLIPTGTTSIGPLIQMMLLNDVNYRGAGFLDRKKVPSRDAR